MIINQMTYQHGTDVRCVAEVGIGSLGFCVVIIIIIIINIMIITIIVIIIII